MSIFTNKINETSIINIGKFDNDKSSAKLKSNVFSNNRAVKELPGSEVTYPSMTSLKKADKKPGHRGMDIKHKLSFKGNKKKKGLTSSGIMNPQRKKMNQSCLIANDDFYIIPDSDKSFYIDLKDKETPHIVILKAGKKGRIDGNDNTFVIIELADNNFIDFKLFHLEPEDSTPNENNDYYRETGGLLFDENRTQYIVRWVIMEKEFILSKNPFLSFPASIPIEERDYGVLQIEGGQKKVHIQTMPSVDIKNLISILNLKDTVGVLDLNELNIDYLESMFLRESFPQDRINIAKENFEKLENK